MTNPVGRFPVRIKDNKHSEEVERVFVGGEQFSLDCTPISKAITADLSCRMLDLLRIASTVYFADRLMKRRRGGGAAGWSRNLTCSIQLRDDAFWNQREIRELLEETIGFVAGDQWKLEFVDGRCDAVCPLYFPQMVDCARPPMTCLYSGGLDSAAGLAHRLTEGIGRQVLPIVVRHRNDIGSLAREQLQTLEREFERTLSPVVVPIEINSPRDISATESSQRTRSFLFLCVGGVVAWATGSSALEMYESGVGAVNSPLLAGMEGSQATRSCHPHFLRLMSKVLTQAAEKPIEVVLPFEMMTKGEVSRSLSRESLRELARKTVSCISYPLRRETGKSCGVCPACLFRRVALHVAGIDEVRGAYKLDLLDSRSWPIGRKKLKYLKAFLLMVDQLTEVEHNRLPVPISRHLIQTGILAGGESQRPYVELYRRYRQEWFSLLREAKANGCKWVDLMDLPAKAG